MEEGGNDWMRPHVYSGENNVAYSNVLSECLLYSKCAYFQLFISCYFFPIFFFFALLNLLNQSRFMLYSWFISQSMTGINSVIFYSTTIFGFAGFDESILATVSVGVVNVGATVLSNYLCDHTGRKTLLVTGTTIMFVSLLALGLVLWVGDSLGSSAQGIIAVVTVLIYIFGFAIGNGCVIWPGESNALHCCWAKCVGT